jgi:nitroimidazol reductase NimA-like FMN-containing flavoprotein (pyridoxamine 5'-phosphate oxidase superfamily)
MPAGERARKSPHRTVTPKAGRPHMPGYGVPRSRKGLLSWTWAERRLTGSHNYWLVTVRPNGRPHAMPVWGVWLDGAFHFSSGRRSRKTRNLARNPRCVVCTDRAHEAVIVEGAARKVKNETQLARVARPYHAKYKPWTLDRELGPVYQVRPRVVFGMHEKRFVSAATRWRF